MFELVLTLCLTTLQCYTSAPLKFDSSSDCYEQLRYLQTTGQIQKNVGYCRMIQKDKKPKGLT